jgi:ornithine cyclodeaminase
VVVTDSRKQALSRGEIGHAFPNGDPGPARLVEIGEIISGSGKGRTSPDDVTVATFSGLAVQDIAIASAVLGQG